jgi:hypothetical protein
MPSAVQYLNVANATIVGSHENANVTRSGFIAVNTNQITNKDVLRLDLQQHKKKDKLVKKNS